MPTYLLVLIIVVLLLLIFAGTGLIVYFAIRKARRSNSQYESFARQHGYAFDMAQGRLNYRPADSMKTSEMIVNLKLFNNPYVEKYANYQTYPFGRGADIKVAYVISGTHQNTKFRAFTYMFTGSTIEHSGRGGVFSIVMVQCENPPQQSLPSQVFYERGSLCSWQQGNLDVTTIHSRIEQLIKLKQA